MTFLGEVLHSLNGFDVWEAETIHSEDEKSLYQQEVIQRWEDLLRDLEAQIEQDPKEGAWVNNEELLIMERNFDVVQDIITLLNNPSLGVDEFINGVLDALENADFLERKEKVIE